eukprot:2405300-Lingulodinium_polyedra.AAC.1
MRFPARLASQVHAHDLINAAALVGFKRRAKLQARLLGDGPEPDAVAQVVWVLAEKGTERYVE